MKQNLLFVRSLRIWIVCIIVFGFSFTSKTSGQNGDDSGALSITSQTGLCSAGFYIKEFNGGNTEKEEDDRARKSLGIGETVTLTLTGKPKGKIEELTWSFESGRDLINKIEETDLKGVTKLTITVKSDLSPDQLKNNSSIKVKVTTSEGRTVSTDPFKVFFPEGIKGMHVGMGTPMEKAVNNGSATHPSMTLLLTLQPESVNFSNINIIERDNGSEPQKGMSLNPGHKGNGCDSLSGLNLCNRADGTDQVQGGFHHHTISDKTPPPAGQHNLPQAWYWKCSFQVHKGSGGPGSEADDIGQIGEEVQQKFELSRSIQKEPVKLKSYSQAKMIFVYYGKVSKFGCSVTRTSTDGDGILIYGGPKEDEQ